MQMFGAVLFISIFEKKERGGTFAFVAFANDTGFQELLLQPQSSDGGIVFDGLRATVRQTAQNKDEEKMLPLADLAAKKQAAADRSANNPRELEREQWKQRTCAER